MTTDEEVLRSIAEMRLRWLRDTARALRDPKTRDQETGYIGRFPWAFSQILDDSADAIEKLLAERKL